MSVTTSAPRVAGLPARSAPPVVRRVRHQARDAVVLMAFSATSSVAVATTFLLLAHLAHTGR
jgi:hypothetical protein